MKKAGPKKITMEIVMNNPRYRGYHVIVVAGKVFKARTGEGASKILSEVRRKYPKETPAITYIPDADTLILWNPCPPSAVALGDCRQGTINPS